MAVSCPKCGQEQAGDVVECIRCGLIFEKFRQEAVTPPKKHHDGFDLGRLREELNAEKERLFLFFRGLATERNRRLVERLMVMTGRVKQWLRDLVDNIVVFVLYFILAWIFGVVLYFGAQAAWHLYLETHVGRQFLVYYPLKAQTIHQIVDYEPLLFMLSICLISALACLVVGAVARLLLLMRMFYEGRGLFLRFIVWPMGCAAFGAWLAGVEYDVDFRGGFALMVFPSLVLCYPCFRLVIQCLPEIDFFRPVQKIYELVLTAMHKAVRMTRPVEAVPDADNQNVEE